MVTKMSAPGRSFGGVADYCLHDPVDAGAGATGERGAGGMRSGDPRTEATEHGERAGADHGSHSGGVPGAKNGNWRAGTATGRKLEKPVCHYSLNWARG